MKKTIPLTLVLLVCLMILAVHCKKKDDTTNGECIWTTIFFDDFNRTDGRIGPNYTVQFYPHGEEYIQDGKLFVGGEAWAIRYMHGVSENKLKVSILFYTTDTTMFNFGVTGRSKDLGNNWSSQEFIMGVTSMTEIGVMKCLGGSPVSIGSNSFTVEANRTYRLSLEIDGGTYTVMIEDLDSGASDSLIVTDSSPLTGTTVSINGMGSQGFFDDFKIEVCE